MVVKKRYLILPVILGGTVFFAGCSPYQDAMELTPKEEVVKEKNEGSALAVDASYNGIKEDEHVFIVSVTNDTEEKEELTSPSGSFVSVLVKEPETGKVVYDSKEKSMETQVVKEEVLPGNSTVFIDGAIKRGAVKPGSYSVTLFVDKSQDEKLEVELTNINLD